MTAVPVQVTFRGLAHSDALETEIRERVTWLEQFYTRIVRCRVVLEVRHSHGQNTRFFHVRIRLTVPGGAPIVVEHEPASSVHQDARLAIHAAFDAARRQLEDFACQV